MSVDIIDLKGENAISHERATILLNAHCAENGRAFPPR